MTSEWEGGSCGCQGELSACNHCSVQFSDVSSYTTLICVLLLSSRAWFSIIKVFTLTPLSSSFFQVLTNSEEESVMYTTEIWFIRCWWMNQIRICHSDSKTRCICVYYQTFISLVDPRSYQSRFYGMLGKVTTRASVKLIPLSNSFGIKLKWYNSAQEVRLKTMLTLSSSIVLSYQDSRTS